MKKDSIVSIIVLVVFVGLIWILVGRHGSTTDGGILFSDKKPMPLPQTFPSTACGITVTNLISNQGVSFPLTVNATVNNDPTAGCGWTMFEGQAGVVTLTDTAHTVLATIPLTTIEDWMVTGTPVHFSAVVTPTGTLTQGQSLLLNITEEDPSGNGGNDTITIPLTNN